MQVKNLIGKCFLMYYIMENIVCFSIKPITAREHLKIFTDNLKGFQGELIQVKKNYSKQFFHKSWTPISISYMELKINRSLIKESSMLVNYNRTLWKFREAFKMLANDKAVKNLDQNFVISFENIFNQFNHIVRNLGVEPSTSPLQFNQQAIERATTQFYLIRLNSIKKICLSKDIIVCRSRIMTYSIIRQLAEFISEFAQFVNDLR